MSGKQRARPNRIKELRTKGVVLTQQELATLLGLDFTTVSHHENGTRELTEEQAARYSRILKIPTHQLFMEPLPSEKVGNVSL